MSNLRGPVRLGGQFSHLSDWEWDKNQIQENQPEVSNSIYRMYLLTKETQNNSWIKRILIVTKLDKILWYFWFIVIQSILKMEMCVF